MFVDFFRYFIKFPLKVEKSLEEYRNLNKLCHDMYKICKIKYDDLVVDCGGKDSDFMPSNGCVVTWVEYSKSSDDSDNFVFYFYRHFCPKFFTSEVCENKNCKNFNKNLAYYEARDKYKRLKNMKNHFWENKLKEAKK